MRGTRVSVSAAAVWLLLGLAGATEITGGISNVGGVQLQEEEYVAQARARGEVVQERQPLLSENNKFWAQVEPVARRRSLQSLGPRKYGPKLMSMQSRRRLLHRERMQRAARS